MAKSNTSKSRPGDPEKTRAVASAAITPAEGVAANLKGGPEQVKVVGPVVNRLVQLGWKLEQIRFGRDEWRIPKSPSQATERERGNSFTGNPVDIAVFDSAKHAGDPRHLSFIIECKQPDDDTGISQLETYLANEPHVKLGIWMNDAADGAAAAFLYRQPKGEFVTKLRTASDLPGPSEPLDPNTQRLAFVDLKPPSVDVLRRTISRLLDKVVARDTQVTRREDQLDQLCSVILLKLESDKQAKAQPGTAPFFRPLASHKATATALRERFDQFVALYPEVFTTERDRRLRLDDDSLAECASYLGSLRLIDLGISTVSTAFQVLRSEALKQGEGQYFTPHEVIQSGVKLLQIGWEDLVIDPACGTGGFLVETMLHLQRTNSGMSSGELSRWAQTHIFGIDKDPIGVKLTKAIMQVAGDGSAHCVRGDSVRTHKWPQEFPHLASGKFADNRFSVVVTNPPFGQNLTVSADDARESGLSIAAPDGTYRELEIGLLFLERAYQLLRPGGRLGIVLPETYFFSTNYLFVQEWMKGRFEPRVVANVPMEAFQGFCRAKTNFYVFHKIGAKGAKK
jgi:type I restriction enzyme M protein